MSARWARPQAGRLEGAAAGSVKCEKPCGDRRDSREEAGKEQATDCLLSYANDDNLILGAITSPHKALVEHTLKCASALKHKEYNETERPKIGSRGSAAKPWWMVRVTTQGAMPRTEGRGRGRGREDGEELWARDSSKMNKARQTVWIGNS